MQKNDLKIKDKKVQFYLPVNEEGMWSRHYPYSRCTHKDGGLWAYIRDKSQIEKIHASMSLEKEILECRLNYNPKINSEYKAIYRNRVYDVSLPDNYEGYTEETKFTLTSSIDNNTYTGDDVYDRT